MLFGFGNAMVDYTVPLTADNPCLEQINAEKGGFFRTDNATFDVLAQKLDVSQAVCGGSVANSLKAFAKLGGKATFFGKIGDDANGALFEQELEAYGIKSSLVKVDGQKSGCSIVFVAQDGEKTATAKRFVAARVFDRDIPWMPLISSDWLFAEGYWLDGNSAKVEKIIQTAYAAGVKIAFTLSDVKIVEENKACIERLMPYFSIVFGNKNEFEAYGAFEPLIKKQIWVKTLGAKGVDVIRKRCRSLFSAYVVDEVVNTNGAGDALAGGFLYQYIKTGSIEAAAKQGLICAAEVVSSPLSHL